MSSMVWADRDSVVGPLVSVVIPVYNRAHLVGRALSSAVSQSYRNLEVIVVDDGSSDGLAAALAAFDDPRLRCLSHPLNRGAAAARNSGVAAARGEFIAFLDSDDFWFADKLAHQVAAMLGQPPEVAGHVCAYDFIKTGYRARRLVPDWDAQSFGRSQLFGCTCGPGTTLLCRSAAFADVGPFDEELRRLEDWDWILRLVAKGYRLVGSATVLARVEVNSSAMRSHVDAALHRIRARHYTAVALTGGRSRRIFEASLYLESAAAALGEKSYARAACAVAHSIVRYPLRGGAFYRRIMERVAASALRRVQASPPALSQIRHQAAAGN
jgi:glycosyltransferase involved in cell wall biosynthesis